MLAQFERARRLFTVEEYQRMAEVGILGPGERVELIEGEIVEMSPINPPHVGCVINLNRLLLLGLRDRAVVSSQNSVVIGPRSQRQPDILVLRIRDASYSVAYATGEDVPPRSRSPTPR